MSWLVSLFSSKSSGSRKGQALTHTHDAFALPTSSPAFASGHDSFNTPEPDSSTSYTYPPSSATPTRGSYDFVPSPTTTRSRHAHGTLLPLHASPLSPLSAHPSLAHTWTRLRAWFANEYPELGDTLNYGILPHDLAQIELQFGFALPAAVRESYLQADGQEPESSAGCSEGLFFGLTLLPLEDVLEEWRFWREVDDDPATGANVRLRDQMSSMPPGWVRKEYSCRGWIPLVTDRAGNYLGVDMNPGEGGAVGQVIVFGRDIDTKVVMWRGDGPGGWARWLAGFAEDLESGEGFELGLSSEGSEGSEDDIGYTSYFGADRAPGEGAGEGGTGGMRLTGEYRGWSVLEAWADRSIRKWRAVGTIPDSSATVTGKSKEKLGLGVYDFAAAASDTSGAEVPIPVVPMLGADIHVDSVPSPTSPVPTIAVTRAPAPQPVDLPTEQDIIPMSPDSDYDPPVPDEDPESGHGVFMHELGPRQMLARRSEMQNQESRRSTLQGVTPADLNVSTRGSSSSVSSRQPARPTPLADLLDSMSPSDASAIEPASPVAFRATGETSPTDSGERSDTVVVGAEDADPQRTHTLGEDEPLSPTDTDEFEEVLMPSTDASGSASQKHAVVQGPSE